jgi:hypothetical protein
MIFPTPTPFEFAYAFFVIACCAFALSSLPVAAPRPYPSRLRQVVLLALAVRWAIGLLVYYYAPYGLFAEDNFVYGWYGQRIVDYWRGVGELPHDMWHRGEVVYFRINAIVFMVFGYSPLVMVALNCAGGALSVWLVYHVAAPLAGPASGIRAATLAAVFPSLVLWSSMNLRDVWALIAILLLVLAAYRWMEERFTAAVALGLAGLVGIYLMRSYLVWIVLAGVGGGLALGLAARVVSPAVTTVLLGLVLLGLVFHTSQNEGLRQTLQEFTAIRQSMTGGGSDYLTDVQFGSAGDVVRFLPVGLIYFLFGPFPWMAGSVRQLFTVPEVLFWYWLIPKAVRGLGVVYRAAPTRAWLLVSLVAFLTIPYSLVSSNMGTAYRHRAQVMPFFLIFAAAGMAAPSSAARGAWSEVRGNARRVPCHGPRATGHGPRTIVRPGVNEGG